MEPQGRLGRRFRDLAARGEAGLVIYLTAFDPSPAETIELVVAAAAAGADVIELGVPWSDPSADGPVIQRAMARALAAGATLRRTLTLVEAIRRRCDVPLVLFGYYNPILAFGPAPLAAAAAAAGVDGLLTVDLPLDDGEELLGPLQAHGLDAIPLLAPTTPEARAARLAALGSGFAYYVSLAGVTGAGHLDVTQVAGRLERLRPHLGGLPVAAGFGVKDAPSARALATVADAVVVGSAVVQAVEGQGDAAARQGALIVLVAALKEAVSRR